MIQKLAQGHKCPGQELLTLWIKNLNDESCLFLFMSLRIEKIILKFVY